MYSGGSAIVGTSTVVGGGALLSNTGANPAITIAICATVAIIALVLARRAKAASSSNK